MKIITNFGTYKYLVGILKVEGTPAYQSGSMAVADSDDSKWLHLAIQSHSDHGS